MAYRTKSQIILSYKSDIAYTNQKINKLDNIPVDEIQEYFEWVGEWSTAFPDLEYRLPFDKAKYLPMIEAWAEQNGYYTKPAYQCVWNESQTLDRKPAAGLFISCINKNDENIKFQFALRTGTDGDNCSLKAIGKKEVAVYEVTCAGAQ